MTTNHSHESSALHSVLLGGVVTAHSEHHPVEVWLLKVIQLQR